MKFKEYDTVELKKPYDGLEAGTVGTILIVYTDPPAYEVEFCDDSGVTLKLLTIEEKALEERTFD